MESMMEMKDGIPCRLQIRVKKFVCIVLVSWCEKWDEGYDVGDEAYKILKPSREKHKEMLDG